MAEPEVTPEEQIDVQPSTSEQGPAVAPADAAPQTIAPPPAAQQNIPQPAPQQAPQGPPVQVVAANPKAHIFHSIMETLGGGDKTQYSVDPQTGTMSATRVPQTTGGLAKSILAGALTGLISGSRESSGAGSKAFGDSATQAAQQRQQQDAQQRQQAQQQYEQQQKAIVQKAQVFKANSDAALNIQQAEKLGDERMDSYIGYMKPMADSAVSEGRVVAGQDQPITQDQALAGMKSGKFNAGEDMFIPTTRIPRINPDGTTGQGSELAGVIVKDGPFNVNSSDFKKDEAVKYGLMPASIANGATIKTSTANQIMQKVQKIDSARDEMKLVHDKLGTAANSMPNFDEAIKTPGMSDALSRFQSYLAGAKGFDPAAAINAMSQEKMNPKTGQPVQNPDAKYVPMIYKMFGGQDVLKQYEDKTKADTSAQKIQEDATARAAAQASTPLGQQELKNAKLTGAEKSLQIQKLQKDLSGPDLSKIQTDPAPLDASGKEIRLTPTDNYPVNAGALEKIRASDPGLAATVEAMGQYRQRLTPQAARTKDGKAILGMVNLVYPRYNDAKAEDYFRQRQDKKMADQLNIMSTAMEHLGTYFDNINPISGTVVTRGIASALGDASSKNAEQSKNAASDEFSKLYKGGAATNDEKKSWDSNLGGSTWLEEKNGARGAAKLLLGKINSYVTQLRNTAPPGMRDDTLQIFSPEAAAAYKRITGEDLTPSAQPLRQGPFAPTGGQQSGGHGRPVIVNGQTVGYTQDGKTMTPVSQ